MIQIEGLNIQYKDRIILKNINLNCNSGKTYALVGPSGCGKSSILQVIGLLLKQSSKRFMINGQDVNQLNPKQIANIRKEMISFVFQDKNSFNDLTVKENMVLMAKLSNKKILDQDMQRYLQMVGLSVGLKQYTYQLSGGEKQRFSIACSLIKDSPIILADEPTSGLDEENEMLIIQLLNDLAHKMNKTVIVATHSKRVMEQLDYKYDLANKLIVDSFDNRIVKMDNKKLNWYSFSSYFLKKSSLLRGRMYSLVLVLIALGLAITVGSLNSREYILKSNINSINTKSNNDLILYSDQLFQDKDIEYYKKIQYITEVNYFGEINLDDYSIFPYIATDLFQLHEKEMVITPAFASQYELKAGDEYILFDQQQPYKVVKILDEPVNAFSDLDAKQVYVQKSVFSNTNQLILHVGGFEYIEGVVNKIHELKPDIEVIVADDHYMIYSSLQETLTRMLMIFGIVITIILFVLLVYIKINQIYHYKFEFALLKANGLTNFETNRIIMDISLIHIIMTVFVSIIFLVIVNYILYRIGLYPENSLWKGINTLLSLIVATGLIPMMIMEVIVNIYSPAILMKN